MHWHLQYKVRTELIFWCIDFTIFWYVWLSYRLRVFTRLVVYQGIPSKARLAKSGHFDDLCLIFFGGGIICIEWVTNLWNSSFATNSHGYGHRLMTYSTQIILKHDISYVRLWKPLKTFDLSAITRRLWSIFSESVNLPNCWSYIEDQYIVLLQGRI